MYICIRTNVDGKLLSSVSHSCWGSSLKWNYWYCSTAIRHWVTFCTSRRHQNNSFEPKHVTIWSMFLWLKSSDEGVWNDVLEIKAIRISNDLYGSDTHSSFETSNGFSKPLLKNQRPIPVDEVLQSAHE